MNQSHRRTYTRAFLLFTIMAWSIVAMRAQAQTLESITVSPNPTMVRVAVPVPMHAIGTFSDGSMRDITSTVQWSASSGLTISPAGVLTVPSGISAGTQSTIAATADSVSGTVIATVAIVTDSEPAVATAATGQLPLVTLVNPLTNQIYTLNRSGDSITVINGATLGMANVSTGKSPIAGAINPFTNTVYASNTDGSVTVFNGNKNTFTNLSVGALPSPSFLSSMAMNPRTNQLYIADFTNSVVDVLNGYTNAVTSYPGGAGPVSVAVNPVTNLVYVANKTGQSVTVLNPAINATSTIPLPFLPEVVGVNTITNKIYAAGPGASGQTALATIDGVANQLTVATYATLWGIFPVSMVVDTVTNRIYITSAGGQTAGIDGETGGLLPTSQFGAGTRSELAAG